MTPKPAKRRRRFPDTPPAPMDGAGLIAARHTLGLTSAALGRALGLEGRDPGQSIRLWETGRAIPGPARVALRYMLAAHASEAAQEGLGRPEPDFPGDPTRTPEGPPSGLPEAVEAAPLRTRRRGAAA